MKLFIKKYKYLLPILLLGVDFLDLFVDFDYSIMGNLLGYSLATNILFFYVFFYGDYCYFTRLSPIGLCVINIINIVGNFISDKFYNFWFVIAVIFVILTLTIILEIDKKNTK